MSRQFELFSSAPRKRRPSLGPPPVSPRTEEQAALVRRLEAAVRHAPLVGKTLSRAALRRLMTPLPPITVPGWGRRA